MLPSAPIAAARTTGSSPSVTSPSVRLSANELAEKCSRYRVRRTASIGRAPRPRDLALVVAVTAWVPLLVLAAGFTPVRTGARAVDLVATRGGPAEWRLALPVVTVAALAPAAAPNTRPKSTAQ